MRLGGGDTGRSFHTACFNVHHSIGRHAEEICLCVHLREVSLTRMDLVCQQRDSSRTELSCSQSLQQRGTWPGIC